MRDRWPDPPADAPLAKPGRVKPTLKRYTWSRLHHDLPTMDLWSLVAEMAASERARVEAFVWRLEIYASTNRPRGSLEGFNLRALAAAWRIEADELARIYAALEDVDVGWIEDEVITTFWERNPDEEDPTAADRAKRSRRRRKIKRAMAARGAGAAEILEALEREGVGYPQMGGFSTEGVTRDTVTVTARADQTRQGSGSALVENGVPGNAEAPRTAEGLASGYQDAASAEVWLTFHGKRLLVERMNEPAPRAEQRVERWRAQLSGSSVALASIIDQVSASDLMGARFMVAITEAIARWRREAEGPSLPLPPVLQQRRAGNG